MIKDRTITYHIKTEEEILSQDSVMGLNISVDKPLYNALCEYSSKTGLGHLDLHDLTVFILERFLDMDLTEAAK